MSQIAMNGKKASESREPSNNCVVCCHRISVYAVGICDHPVCFLCSTRMRVLCRQNECPICRRDMPKVIFTETVAPFYTLNREMYPMDRKYKICFRDRNVQEKYRKLLEHACQRCPSRPLFLNFGQLKEHVRRDHELYYCDLCVEHLKIFTFERKCYNRKELARHRRAGDLDDTSHRGHPLCEFCEDRFLDNDELFRHLRRQHFFCHFCDADGLRQFYSDYDSLRSHFQQEHFLCEEGTCQDEKFTAVFRTEIDLKAHKATTHSKNLSRGKAKQVRTLELEFTITPRNLQNESLFPTSHDEPDMPRRGRRGYHRGNRNCHAVRDRENEDTTPVEDLGERERHPIHGFLTQALNTQCEKEFPHLSSTSAPTLTTSSANSNSTLATRLAKQNCMTVKAVRQPFNNVLTTSTAMSDADFPTLGSPVHKIPPRVGSDLTSQVKVSETQSLGSQKNTNTLLFRINSHEEGPASTSRAPNVSIHVSRNSNTRSSELVGGSSRTNEPKQPSIPQNLVLQAGTRPQPTASALLGSAADSSVQHWGPSRNLNRTTFNEDFPRLDSAKKPIEAAVSSVIIPVTKPNSIVSDLFQSQDPILQNQDLGWVVKGKAKKKKAKSNLDSMLKGEDGVLGEKPLHPNGYNVDQKDIGSKLQGDNFVNGECVEDFPVAHATRGSVQKEEKGGGEGHGTRESSILLGGFQVPTMNLKLEEFPPLPVCNNQPGTPPGFLSHKVGANAVPPPGFKVKEPNTGQKHSGLNISLSSVARQLSGSEPSTPTSLTFTNSSGNSFSVTTQPSRCSQTYTHPADFHQRNVALIEEIQQILNGDAHLFNEFKSFSGKFRQGDISAQEYYDTCISILGWEGFLKVLLELLVLLPSINRQQELLGVHNTRCKKETSESGALSKNATSSGSGAGIQFLVCASCQQVLARKDFRNHMSVHSLDSSFPSLPASSHSTTTHITWVKNDL